MNRATKLLIVNIFFMSAIVWSIINYMGAPEQQTLGVLITVMIGSALGNALLLKKGARVRQ